MIVSQWSLGFPPGLRFKNNLIPSFAENQEARTEKGRCPIKEGVAAEILSHSLSEEAGSEKAFVQEAGGHVTIVSYDGSIMEVT